MSKVDSVYLCNDYHIRQTITLFRLLIMRCLNMLATRAKPCAYLHSQVRSTYPQRHVTAVATPLRPSLSEKSLASERERENSLISI